MKTSFLAIVGIFCIMNASAQNKSAPYTGDTLIFIFKPQLGVCESQLTKGNRGNETGFLLGGSIVIGNKIYIEPGLYYVYKRLHFDSVSASRPKMRLGFSGVRIPFTIGYNIVGRESSFFNVHIMGGGSLYFLREASRDSTGSTVSGAGGVFAGTGCNIGKFFIESTYEWTFTNVHGNLPGLINLGRLRSLYCNAGIRFELQ